MYLLGFDVGSSSVKASLIDIDSGKCVSDAFYPSSEAPIISHRPGWAEQDPQMWWDNLVCAAKKALSGRKDDIAAIGISYQMHGLVCIDQSGNPLRNSIIWCDSRAVPYGQKAFDELGHDRCMGSLLNSPGNFTASKLAWVKENEPELYKKIWKVLLPGDYIAMRLTGEICTSISGLSEAMLWDYGKNMPAEFLMDFFGFDHDLFPKTTNTFSDQGRLSSEAAEALGLKAGIPVTYRAGDQPNNALSLNVLRPGEIASTAGTSGVVYGVSDKVAYDPQSRVNTFVHVNHSAEAPRLGVLLCINGTGIMNSWIRRNVAPESISYGDMNSAAANIPIGSEGLCILPFGNGAERMLGNRELGCIMKGIGFNTHSRDHIIRAAQEGIVFSFQYGMEIMQSMGMKISSINAGMANMFLSDIFRNTLSSVSGAVIKLMSTDGAAGAASGAGIGAGIYRSADEAFANVEILKTIEPDMARRQEYLDAYGRWKSVLEETLNYNI